MKFNRSALFLSGIMVILSGIFFMGCSSNTPTEDNITQRYEGEEIEDGAAVGMIEIRKIDPNNPPQSIGELYKVYVGEEKPEENGQPVDKSLISGQLVIHIINTSNGKTYVSGTEGQFYAFKYLPNGTYRVYLISKNNAPLIKPVDLALNFTIRQTTVVIIPRIQIYHGIRVISTHPPALTYRISNIPYPKVALNTYLDELLTSGEKREFRVVD